jgi:rfaE bifunctional protein nucleotidyltransferase chain/domain
MDNKKVFSSAAEIAARFKPMRDAGKRLVTTNGCFDILHAGHVQYLYQARALGELLVVGINADVVVRKLKGSDRPIQSEADRCFLVSSLEMVDAAFVFSEDDPRAFIEALRPDIHVKGGDYSTDIIERPVVERCGGVVRIVPFMPGRSTTAIIAKLKPSC